MNEQFKETINTENVRQVELNKAPYPAPNYKESNYNNNNFNPFNTSNNFNVPAYPQYYPAIPRKLNPLVQLVFWFFYLTVALPVSFSLTLALWACALVLPLTLPLTILRRTGVIGENVVSMGDWLSEQSDAVIYAISGSVTLVGLLLLLFAVLTVRPWFSLHRAAMRDLGGLNI